MILKNISPITDISFNNNNENDDMKEIRNTENNDQSNSKTFTLHNLLDSNGIKSVLTNEKFHLPKKILRTLLKKTQIYTYINEHEKS